MCPDARLTIIDANQIHLDGARALLDPAGIEFVHALLFTSERPHGCDLLVIPLSYSGDRTAVYAHPPAPAVIVHDWIWRRRGASRIVSVLLLKRINLVSGSTIGERDQPRAGVARSSRRSSAAGHPLVLSWWSPIAYLWHDAAIVADLRGRRASAATAPAIGVDALRDDAGYAVLNVPVERALSSPLTWTMWRAAGGALADSIRYYATW